MGWVVDFVCRRWAGARRYRSDQWDHFCRDNGIVCIQTVMPPDIPAAIIDDVVLVDERLHGAERDYHIWHELGHFAMHAGDELFIQRLRCGWMILSKQERQATEFALRYPVWDPGTAEEIARERGIFCGETR